MLNNLTCFNFTPSHTLQSVKSEETEENTAAAATGVFVDAQNPSLVSAILSRQPFI